MDREKIGALLRQLRLEKGMTQKEAAHAAANQRQDHFQVGTRAGMSGHFHAAIPFRTVWSAHRKTAGRQSANIISGGKHEKIEIFCLSPLR